MKNALPGGTQRLISVVRRGTQLVWSTVLLALGLSLATAALAGAGTLGPGDAQLETGEFYDRVTFSGVAGDEIRIDLLSTDFVTYLMIADSNDTVLAEASGSPDTGDGLRMNFTLPASGTYTLIVTSYFPGETGGYTLILAAADQPASAMTKPAGPAGLQPGTVTGRVVDTQGQPIAGAQVTLRPALTTGQADFRTDAEGYYRAESLPDVPYYARAWTYVEYGGQRICMRLGMESETDFDTFSPTNGAVRNFRMQLSGPIGDMHDAIDGHFGGAIYFFDAPDRADGEQVEFTFIPTGPLIDGSRIEPFTRTYSARDGNLIRGIPVGPYQVSAEVVDESGNRQPLPLSLSLGGDPVASINVDWMGDGTCTLNSGFEWVNVYSADLF